VGRKNWLFFQEETGGSTAAIVLTLLMTAKAIGLVPQVYLRDVLLRLATCSDVTKLTPHGWMLSDNYTCALTTTRPVHPGKG
jgi:transposase